MGPSFNTITTDIENYNGNLTQIQGNLKLVTILWYVDLASSGPLILFGFILLIRSFYAKYKSFYLLMSGLLLIGMLCSTATVTGEYIQNEKIHKLQRIDGSNIIAECATNQTSSGC